MKRFTCIIISALLVVFSSIIPPAFTEAAKAGTPNTGLEEVTNAADSIVIGTVVERSSYWNDEHTGIFTSAVLSVEERLKGPAAQNRITVTSPGGEADGMWEWVSDMASFEPGEKAVVFLKGLSKSQLPAVKDSKLQLAEEQFEVYGGFRGKFAIERGSVGNLPLAEFKERVGKVVKGQVLPPEELNVLSSSPVTFPYSYAGYCWPHPPNPVVSYRINQNTADCTGEGAAVQAAAATWNAAGARFSFSYSTTTSATAYSNNSINEILWRNLGSGGTIAHALIWGFGTTITECDMEFNEYYNWSTAATPPSDRFDVQTTALHEFGHYLCLADLYNPADSAKVMYGYGDTGEKRHALHADDIAGIRSIYGVSLPPSAPTDLAVAVSSSSQIDLVWTDNAGNETGFKIERKTGLADTYAQIATVGADITSYSSTGLAAGTTYYYRVRAYVATGNSEYSNEADATTLPPPPPAPVLKLPLNAAVVSTLTPRLEWNASAGATDYNLQVSTASTFTTLLVDATGITDIFYDIPGAQLNWNTTYYWKVQAVNVYDSASPWSAYRSFKTAVGPPPLAPSGLSATPVSSIRIDLGWTDNAGNETGFKIERKKGVAGTYAQIAAVGANITSYSSIGLVASTEYYYRVRAYSAAGNSEYSNEDNATTLPPPPPPLAPSGLIATPVSSIRVDLSWTDNAGNETGFKIERKTGLAGTYAQIRTVGANITSYGSTGLVASTEYYYRVRAYSAAGNSGYCDEVSVTTLPPPPPRPILSLPASGAAVAELTPRLEWNASTGASDYGLQVSATSNFAVLAVNETGITDLFYDILPGTLNLNVRYYWRVNARGPSGSKSLWSAPRYFRTPVGPAPDAPSDLLATTASSSQINLTWQDHSINESSFKIERKTGAGGTYALVKTVGAGLTSCSSTALTASTTYYYRVRAWNPTGYSDYCTEVSATTLPPPPPKPTLASPAGGAVVSSLTPRLEWNTSTGATDYGIQVSTTSAFAVLLVNETGITDLFYDVPSGILSPNTRYYWKVNASGPSGSTSLWSSYRYFRTPAGP